MGLFNTFDIHTGTKMSAASNLLGHLLKLRKYRQSDINNSIPTLILPTKRTVNPICEKKAIYLSLFQFWTSRVSAWGEWSPSIHMTVFIYIFYASGQERDEILPVTGKAILCNGSCFTVATFQKEVQYLNMWYPVPNQGSEQPLLSMWGSHCADNLYLWLSDLTPWKVLFLSDVSMQGKVNRKKGYQSWRCHTKSANVIENAWIFAVCSNFFSLY